MYRIRLASGAETTYHSIDELTSALQGGEVTAEALIYHQRADRWLTITNHPHYKIAMTRATGEHPAGSRPVPSAQPDAGKRQVIAAIRPSGSHVPPTRVQGRPEVPPTAIRDKLFEVVAEMEKANQPKAAPRKLSIPAPRKPDNSGLRAHENVLEGVVVDRLAAPAPTPPAPVSPAAPVSRTTVLPIRAAKPPAPETPSVPDLGDGLDLVEEPIAAEPMAAPPQRVSGATPQVDRLLELLEPAPKPAPEVAPRTSRELKLIDPGTPSDIEPAAVLAAEPEIVEQAPEPEPYQVPAHLTYRRRRREKKAVMVAAAVALVAVGTFFWKPWASATERGAEGAVMASLPRTEAFGGSSSSPVPPPAYAETPAERAAPAPAIVAPTVGERPIDSAPSIIRVVAPRNMGVPPTPSLEASNISAPTQRESAGALIQRYNAAYNEARSELELRMLQVGFTQIFLRSRLSTAAGIQDTRRLIASASGALRQYRGDESRIERAYQDTIGVAGRNVGWGPRDLGTWNAKPGQQESGETLRLTNLMLSQMDSTFSLLANQIGKYRITGEAIVFDDPDAARQYGALRGWLNQQADKYSGSGDALPATLRQVVKAIGATRLPAEKR